MKQSLIFLFVFIAIQFGVSTGVTGLWRLASGSSDITSIQLIVSMAAFSVITAAVFLLARWACVSRHYVRSRPWDVLFWCVVASVGAIIPSVWLQELLPELPDWSGDTLGMIMKNRWGYVVVGLLAPVAEEIVFRGAILRSLLGSYRRHWSAIAVSALLFAAAHANPAQMPHAFLVGLLLGWMYYRTDSIVPGVAYHWVNNSIAYAMYNVLPDPDMRLAALFGGSQTRVLLAVMFSLCILLPAVYQLNMRLRRA